MDITYYKKYEPIFNEWKIVREIGAGSFGKVFEIERVDDFNGDIYKAALKAITIPQSESEIDSIMDNGLDQDSVTTYFRGVVDEFIEEFKLMSKLEGESNIVSYKGHRVVPHEDKVGWDILIHMELLTPLLKHTRENSFGREDVINLGIDMCKALELCRKHNIIHRDIKPENIFISNNGKYKLGDFGIAKTVEKTTGGLSKKGTYTYMAPEVYKGEKYGPSVDIYSLGIVLYRYLNNNRAPFLPPPPSKLTHTDANAALERRIVLGEKIPAPANADEQLSKIILKACAYNSKERYANPTEMREDLEAVAAGMAPIHAAIFLGEDKTASDNPVYEATESDVSEAETVKEHSDINDECTVGIFGVVTPPVEEEPDITETPPQKPKPEKKQTSYEDTAEDNNLKKKNAQKDSNGKKKKAPIIIAAVLLLAIIAGIFGSGGLGKPAYQEDWTEWSEELPRGVDEDDFVIEEQIQYRSRNKETTSSPTSDKMAGWTLEKTAKGGDFGAWSDWSQTAATKSDKREVETETRYRSRNLETTTGKSSSKSGWTLTDTTYTWSDYGAWSSWSTSKPTASDSRKVESKTQYRYRSISYTTKYTGWSSWSSWQDSYVSSNDTTQVKTRTVYAYYYFSCRYCGAHMHYWGDHVCYTWMGGCGRSNAVYEDSWTLVWSTTPWSSAVDTDGTGHPYIGSKPNCLFVHQNSGSKTQYSYCTRSTYQEASYGSWSSWSDTAYSKSSTRDVETRTVYRYCDRSKVPTYHFQRWGDWSNWSTQQVSPNSTKQVESATFYRYRDKTDETVYIFSRWTAWSDWTTEVIEDTDDNEVETKILYRYKSK